MKKAKHFKLVWHYLKHDKLKLALYIFLVFATYLPVLFSAYFWGKALELLILKDTAGFMKFLILWECVYILTYSVLQIPREFLYSYLEIKFTKNVSKDLYRKVDCLPAIAFEDIGVGEFINRLYTDPDRVMELLQKLIKLLCKGLVIILVFVVSFNISLLLGFEILLFAIIMGFISYRFFPKIKKTQENIKKECESWIIKINN